MSSIQDAQLLVSGVGVFVGFVSLLAQNRTYPALLPTYVKCPNCGQPFDVSRFPVVNGKRKVTCPRCWYTWEL